MFELEQAIAAWRQRLESARIKAPDVLDELESHLRDDIDALLRTGLKEQQAFQTAVAQIGELRTLKNEFGAEQKAKRHILLAAIGAYALITIVPVLFKLGSFADVTWSQQRWALAAVLVTVIGFFAGRFFGRMLPHVSKRALLITTAAAVLLQLVWLIVFFHHILQTVEWDTSQVVLAVLWGMSPISLFSIPLGMEEAAAGRTPKSHV